MFIRAQGIRAEVETKRDRRITPDGERKLLEAADRPNCAEMLALDQIESVNAGEQNQL